MTIKITRKELRKKVVLHFKEFFGLSSANTGSAWIIHPNTAYGGAGLFRRLLKQQGIESNDN